MKSIPDDNPSRRLTLKGERDNLLHIGIVGDTYTVVVEW